MDNKSLSHTRWSCQYHIVFIPKYRKKVMFGKYKVEMKDIIKRLCEYKKVEIIEGAVCSDQVHLCVSIPPKLSISEFVGYLKGKSALMIYDKHPEMGSKWNRSFWARGYYITTIGNITYNNIYGACGMGYVFAYGSNHYQIISCYQEVINADNVNGLTIENNIIRDSENYIIGEHCKNVKVESNTFLLKGDINADGTFNVADVVALQKWLLAVPDAKLADWKAGNFCNDDRLDVFDLCIMKRELLKNRG